MRAPAATVSEPALRSPTTTPVASRSTRVACCTLPSSSTAIVILSARHPPVSVAPTSIVRSPGTLTSPLNLPAIRTLPPPSILPSITMSLGITDALRDMSELRVTTGVAGAGEGVDTGAGAGVDGRSALGALSKRAGSGAGGGVVGVGWRTAVLSFHMAMGASLGSGGRARIVEFTAQGRTDAHRPYRRRLEAAARQDRP